MLQCMARVHGAVGITCTAWLVPQRAASGAEATKKQARSCRALLGPLSVPCGPIAIPIQFQSNQNSVFTTFEDRTHAARHKSW